MSRLRIPSLPLTLLALVVAWPLFAQQPPPPQDGNSEHPSMRDLDAMGRQERARTLSDAVRRAQASSGGQVLGAERVQFDGHDITRVKIMDGQGRVRYYDEDPQSRLDRRGGPDAARPPAPMMRPRSANPGRP